jgi:hypothetical protein
LQQLHKAWTSVSYGGLCICGCWDSELICFEARVV